MTFELIVFYHCLTITFPNKCYDIQALQLNGSSQDKTINYKANCVKCQVQGFREIIKEGGLESVPVYKGVVHCITTVYQQEGLVGFYKGAVPSLLKVRTFLWVQVSL